MLQLFFFNFSPRLKSVTALPREIHHKSYSSSLQHARAFRYSTAKNFLWLGNKCIQAVTAALRANYFHTEEILNIPGTMWGKNCTFLFSQ